MCFVIAAAVSKAKAEEIEALIGQVPSTDGKVAWVRSGESQKEVQLVAPSEYSTCCFVTSIEQSAARWQLDPEWAPHISIAVEHLHTESPHGISLWALFWGDPVESMVRTTIGKVLQAIDGGSIENRTKFILPKAS